MYWSVQRQGVWGYCTCLLGWTERRKVKLSRSPSSPMVTSDQQNQLLGVWVLKSRWRAWTFRKSLHYQKETVEVVQGTCLRCLLDSCWATQLCHQIHLRVINKPSCRSQAKFLVKFLLIFSTTQIGWWWKKAYRREKCGTMDRWMGKKKREGMCEGERTKRRRRFFATILCFRLIQVRAWLWDSHWRTSTTL